MEKDSFETSRALSHPVSSPSDISAMFDTITYDKVILEIVDIIGPEPSFLTFLKMIKGGSVIRMMTSFLTQKAFMAGIVVSCWL